LDTKNRKFFTSDLSSVPKWRIIFYYIIFAIVFGGTFVFISIQENNIPLWRNILALSIVFAFLVGLPIFLNYLFKNSGKIQKYLPIIMRIWLFIMVLQILSFIAKLLK